jgi:hypothetical protein
LTAAESEKGSPSGIRPARTERFFKEVGDDQCAGDSDRYPVMSSSVNDGKANLEGTGMTRVILGRGDGWMERGRDGWREEEMDGDGDNDKRCDFLGMLGKCKAEPAEKM